MNARYNARWVRAGALRRRSGAVLSAQLLLAACYGYGPPGGAVPEPGTHVSLHLSTDASRSFALQIGPGVTYVEGVVLGDDSAGLHLAVSHVEGQGGGSSASWAGEHFVFPHDTYLALEVRRLSVPGTMLVGGLSVAAVVAMSEAFRTGGTGNTPGGTIPSPTQ